MSKFIDSPADPLSIEEKRKKLKKTFISKNDFILLSDLPKKEALKIFNKIRRNYVNERKKLNKDTSYFADPSSSYLPTAFVIKSMPTLKALMKGD